MGRTEKTTWSQINAVLEFLEIPSNFRLITGSSSPTAVVAGSKVRKADAYKDLGNWVNSKLGYTNPPHEWDAKKAKARYESLYKKYKETKRQHMNVNGPKFCLTEAELLQGETIESKLNKLCQGYARWDLLYGERQNINPTSIMTSVEAR